MNAAIDTANAVALTDPTDFIKTVFGHTTNPVHFCSLGNERDGIHPPRKLDSREFGPVQAFISKWDMAERGLFYCASTLIPSARKRNKENVSELAMLFTDIDLKDVSESVEEIEHKIKNLRCPPSMIVRSGNGVHALWLLKEALDIQSEGMIDRIEADLRQLADLVGGDLQICEVARLLRLPGTHNTKHGAFKEVVVSHQSDIRYELDDLEEFLAETSPVILRKARERAVTAGEFDPYADYGALAYKAPLDVKARLDAMMFMGGGEAAVHATQLAVSSSMLNAGASDEEVVEILLNATKAAAGDYGERWNWRIEERTIRGMCASWHKKYTAKGTAKTFQQPEANQSGTVVNSKVATGVQPDNSVVSLAGAAALKKLKAAKPAPKDGDELSHVKLGTVVIGVIQSRGDDVMFTEKGAWRCTDGLWTMAADMTEWLNVEIEKAAQALDYPSTIKQINETRQWIQRSPKLRRENVKWDSHGKVPTRSGLVDPMTGAVTPAKPEHYATWRIEAEYDPAAKCPWWLQMLEDCFSDRSKEERAATINVIQELLGVGLIDTKPRGLSKALIFQGGSNFGKSGLLEVLGGLFGRDQNSTPIEALEGAHGLMPFIRRRPWVLHEAFDQRKWNFSSSVKAIVTGEPIQVNIKNGPMLDLRINAPIFWGTNHPPQFKEATKAIVNRLVVIECKREFLENKPVGAAIEAFKRKMDKPSTLVLETELPGVLAWAIAGLKRALERGFLSLTIEMADTADEIRKDSNLVAGFLEECCSYDMDNRLSSPDFCLAFGAWWLANKGENRGVPSNESIGRSLAAMSDAKIAINRELRDAVRRYYGGVVLNEEGLAFHKAGWTSRDLQGKTANATVTDGPVNQLMSGDWLQKPSIKAMREQQMTVPNRAMVMSETSTVTVMTNDRSPIRMVTLIGQPKF